MSHKIRFAVCETLLAEVRAAVAAERFENSEIVPLPMKCCAATGLARLDPLIEANRKGGDQIFIFGESCPAGSKRNPPGAASGAENAFDQCASFFADRALIEKLVGEGAYLLTPGWVRGWRDIIREWGFDRPTARAFFAETMTRIILFDTGTDPAALENVRAFADFVGLPWSVRPAGLDRLRLFLRTVVSERRLEEERRKISDFALLSELSGDLTGIATEAETVQKILSLFQSLFAPRRLVFLPFAGDLPGEPVVIPEGDPLDDEETARLRGFTGPPAFLDSGDGFRLPIRHRDELLGLVEVRGLAFPEHRDHFPHRRLGRLQRPGFPASPGGKGSRPNIPGPGRTFLAGEGTSL